jgi:hypothetical protein
LADGGPVRTGKGGKLLLPCPPNHRALSCCADSPRGCRPSMTFVFLGS